MFLLILVNNVDEESPIIDLNSSNFSITNKNTNSNNIKVARLSESESSSSWENKHHDTNVKTKTENRLKLTIRVKRSPEFPEYEILRTEGINNYSESTSETISTISNASSKHRKHRHKKNKNKRSEKFDIDEKGHVDIPSTRVKSVKLLFGDNEMKILNIPSLDIDDNNINKNPSFY